MPKFTILQKLCLLACLLFTPLLAPNFLTPAPASAQAANPGAAQAQALLEQAIALANQQKYDQAVQVARQAVAMYQQLKDRRGEGVAWATLAEIAVNAGTYGEARQFSATALQIGQELEDAELIIGALPLLGQSLGNGGDYGSALGIYQGYTALLRLAKAGISSNEPQMRQQIYAEEGSALNTLGTIYSAVGQYDRAIEYYKQSLAIAREVQDRAEEAENLFRLVVAYGYKEDRASVDSYLQQLTPIIQDLNNPKAKAAFSSLRGAIAYYLDDNPDQAIDYYRQSLTLAQNLNDLDLLQDALLNAGTILTAKRDYARAIEALALAGQLADQGLSYANAVEIANALAVALMRNKQLPEAEQALQTSLKLAEGTRSSFQSDNATANDINKVSLFDTQAQTYDLFQKVLIAQNRPEQALEIAERGRARSFAELLTRRLEGNRKQPQSQDLGVKPIQIEEIKRIAREQQATLVQYAIIYDDLWGRGKPKAREAGLFIWVVKPTGDIAFRQVDLQQALKQRSLNELVTVSRESIGVRGLTFQEDARIVNQVLRDIPTENARLRQLHQLLIEPIADLLPAQATEQVIFIPQGPLFGVPFPALQDAAGQYLIDRHTISIAPAIQVLGLTRQQRQRVRQANLKNMLVVGNPVMPRVPPQTGDLPQQLTTLPGSEQEAKAIARILKTQPLLGKQATKSAIIQQMKQARIIHLATHGLLDFAGSKGIQGAIALAPDGKQAPVPRPNFQGIDDAAAMKVLNEWVQSLDDLLTTCGTPPDGLLTTCELLDMKLNAELVVLSACDTGRGKITGDGVIGLSRALIIAGVPSVVVSLWQVPDAPTAELMTTFYKTLQTTPNKAVALRQAMLETRRSYPDPKAWAAFSLIGEAE